jgi:hypothetical protein
MTSSDLPLVLLGVKDLLTVGSKACNRRDSMMQSEPLSAWQRSTFGPNSAVSANNRLSKKVAKIKTEVLDSKYKLRFNTGHASRPDRDRGEAAEGG